MSEHRIYETKYVDALVERICKLEAQQSATNHPNVLKNVSSEWDHEKNDNCVMTHHKMVEGVLCRWWGDGPEPKGVAIIDAAISKGNNK